MAEAAMKTKTSRAEGSWSFPVLSKTHQELFQSKKQGADSDKTNTFPNTAASKFHTTTLQTYRMLITPHAYRPGCQKLEKAEKGC